MFVLTLCKAKTIRFEEIPLRDMSPIRTTVDHQPLLLLRFHGISMEENGPKQRPCMYGWPESFCIVYIE